MLKIKNKNIVLSVSLSVIGIIIVWGLIPESWLGSYSLHNVMGNTNSFILKKFGWYYSLFLAAGLILVIYLIFSKYGSIKLGKDNDSPQFSYLTWLSMLFSAGMGIGLVFFGISEPLSHLNSPLSDGMSENERIRFAMIYSFFHWGLQPWAIYSIVALIIAYFTFRKGKSYLISSCVTPLFRTSSSSKTNNAVDIFAILATVFGIIPSIGIGAQQISGGLSYLFPKIDNTLSLQLIIIIVFTFLFLYSAQSGLKRGIKYLSNINVFLAAFLLLFVLFSGPTMFIMDFFTTILGSYIQQLPQMSLRLNPLNPEGAAYIQDWTIFYWGWWISWTPFVGIFIARISKGRTIREFLSGVVIVPSLICMFWFTVFGGASIYIDKFMDGSVAEQIAANGNEIGLFALLEHFHFSSFTTILGMILIAIFFITSADSATFVVSMLSSDGSLNPPNKVKFLWGIVLSLLACVLLVIGGLSSLQTAAIIGALPFSFIIIWMVISFIQSLKEEKLQ
nr:BCCT family transporter [Peribacillus faecalis]